MLQVANPYQQFFDASGHPLDAGLIYIGVVGRNPITDPVQIYWDEDGEQPAPQPIRTMNGYMVRNGTPARVYLAEDDYSISVYDKQKRLLYYEASVTSISTLRDELSQAGGSGMVGFLQAGNGAVLRTAQSKMREIISVRDFLAIGDGSADDTMAISVADVAASLLGKDLFFPAGTYMADPLVASTSWYGEIGTVIKYRGTGKVDLVTANGVNGITFRDLRFDGNVSVDPSAWNSSNYDSFTGATGLSIGNCANPRVINCHTQNTRQHGFRYINCTDAVWQSCTSKRARGNFGDCFIAFDMVGLTIDDCHANDHTRIGFVVDTFGNNPHTSYGIRMTNCSAKNGHDASVNYGGSEYNVGCWMENTADVQVCNFTAKNQSYAGLLLCSGIKNNGFTGSHALYEVNNCIFDNTKHGFISYDLNGFPVSVNASNIQARGISVGMYFVSRTRGNSFSCSNSHVDVDFSITPALTCPYFYGLDGLDLNPTISFVDCTVAHTNENTAMLIGYGETSSSADVGSYLLDSSRAGPNLVVRNVRNIDSTKPTWIGVPYNQSLNMDVSDCYVRMSASFLNTGTASVENCRIQAAKLGDGGSSRTDIKNCTIEGMVSAGGMQISFKNNKTAIVNSDFVWLFTKSTGKKPSIVISGCYFEKDINSHGKILRTQFGLVSNTTVVSDCQFYNSGAATSINKFIEHASGEFHIFSGVLKDSSVTYMIGSDEGFDNIALPPGCTEAAFH